ncbi:MAG: hypothetical protein ABI613_07635 [Gemmatimonadota bacterium]
MSFRSVIIRGCLCLLLTIGFAEPAGAQEYDPAPLRTPATLPADGLPASQGEFIQWLETNAASVPRERQAAVREHVYALISANVKARVAAGFPAFPGERDSALADLFSWGDRLGVFGAYRVARALDATRPHLPPANLVPRPFEITLDSGYFTFESSRPRWAIRFPYYFMLGAATHQRMGTDFEGDVIVLSTLFAPNDPAIGSASQATILLIATDSAAADRGENFWLNNLALDKTPTGDDLLPGTRDYRGFDTALSMNKEMVSIPIPGGVMLIAYLGLTGTFEANRPHFLNLLESLRTTH